MIFTQFFCPFKIPARIEIVLKTTVRTMGKTCVCVLEILCGMQTVLIALVRNQPYLTSEKYVLNRGYSGISGKKLKLYVCISTPLLSLYCNNLSHFVYCVSCSCIKVTENVHKRGRAPLLLP